MNLPSINEINTKNIRQIKFREIVEDECIKQHSKSSVFYEGDSLLFWFKTNFKKEIKITLNT